MAPPLPALDPARVRGLIFDLDGTLVDSYGAILTSLNHARASFDLDEVPADELRRNVGHGLESLIEDYLGPERVDAGVRLFRDRYATAFREATHALPGADTTLRELSRRGYPLSVASNKPARFGEKIVEQLGWSDLFSCIEGPDRAGSTKPEPTMLRRCMEQMGTEQRATLYVGDMVLDVESASRAGVSVVLVQGGSSSPADLRLTGQRVLSRLEGLLEILPG